MLIFFAIAFFMTRLRRGVAAVLAAVTLLPAAVHAAQVPLGPADTVPEWAGVGPTVREVVEFKRILQPINHNPQELRQQLSPDGTRAFLVTRKADVATDKNRYEIHLLHLAAERLAERRVPAPEVVFTADVAEDGNDALPAIKAVRWWDDRSLVFLARLKDDLQQVYRLDLPKRELVQLTHEANPVVSFAASRDMRRLVYAVQVPNPPLQGGARSLVVGNQSLWNVKFGHEHLLLQARKYRFFVADVAGGQPPRALGDAFAEGNSSMPQADISPDGRWALLPRYEPDRTVAWSQVYPLLNETMTRYGPGLRRDPLSYYSGTFVYKARRLTAWNLDEAREQGGLDAPDDALTGSAQDRRGHVWLPGGSVVIAGTHLPVAGRLGDSTASHVVEFWPDTGRWQVVARLTGRLVELVPQGEGFTVIDAGSSPRRFQRTSQGGWHEQAGAAESGAPTRAGWSLQIRESLNEPADVFAVSPQGQALRMTTLNPQFEARTWGRMQPYAWRDARGRRWDGGLMVPSGVAERAKLPLVIQTYGFSGSRFYLDGPNRGNGATSAFAGRAFLRGGFLVLAMPIRPDRGPAGDGAEQLHMFNEGVKAAIRQLVQQGRVDPARVGIVGWSATGLRVLNLITFSKTPILAATIADGDENSLFSYTLTYGFADSTWQHKEQTNRGTPYGVGLQRWVHNDPALHTDCIRSALRIESYGRPLKNNWDVYALMRRQYKPVEMILIPEGGHALATPSERMISLQGNLDWFRFWLTGQQRTQPEHGQETVASLKAQYERWEQMRTLQLADHARPRCVRPPPWR